MKQWEYKVIYLDLCKEGSDLETKLCKLGLDGWELVNTKWGEHCTSASCTLKRELKGPDLSKSSTMGWKGKTAEYYKHDQKVLEKAEENLTDKVIFPKYLMELVDHIAKLILAMPYEQRYVELNKIRETNTEIYPYVVDRLKEINKQAKG
jgi:hypothetical protein